MKKILVVFFLLCLGLMGCATAGFARYRGVTYESAVPIYQGVPGEQYPYRSIGYVTGKYKAGVFGNSDSKLSQALADMANSARGMGANAIININLRRAVGLVYYEGEAVVFNVLPNE